MFRQLAVVTAGIIGVLAGPAGAHPHIFIDTGLELIFDDQGRASAVRVSWSYDDFYSLMMIEDRELDADFDGVLTPEEEEKLTGFDMAWDADYDGDLYVLNGGEPVALGRPSDFTVRYEGGRITSTHLRALQAPVKPDGALVLQAYDPGYYVAYTITGDPVLTGAPAVCRAEVFEPDLGEADLALQEALKEYGADVDIEVQFPAVGAAYADEMRVICPGV